MRSELYDASGNSQLILGEEGNVSREAKTPPDKVQRGTDLGIGSHGHAARNTQWLTHQEGERWVSRSLKGFFN